MPAVKVTRLSVQQAVESIFEAFEEKCPQKLRGYLALNDSILDRITHISIHDCEELQQQKQDHDPKWNNLMKVRIQWEGGIVDIKLFFPYALSIIQYSFY